MGTQLLDTVLMYLYNNRRYQYIDEVHKNISPEIPIIDILVILNKLSKDGNVTIETHTIKTRDSYTREILETDEKDSYFISFEGVLFVEDGLLTWKSKP